MRWCLVGWDGVAGCGVRWDVGSSGRAGDGDGRLGPHLARRVFGADTRHLLPAAVLIGALVGVGCDDLARTLLPGEIPIGILTSFIGACFFLVVITRPGPANGPGGTGGTS